MSALLGPHTRKFLSGLFLVSIVLLAVTKTKDTDAWMHLSLGRLVWASKGFPATEVFVYPSLNLPFNYSSWLFGVAYFLAYQVLQLYGVILLKAVTVTAGIFLLFRDSLRPHRNYVVSLLVMMVVAVMLRFRFVERPDTFTMVFLAFNIYCLNALVYEDRRRLFYLLPLVNMLWANSHSSVVLMFIPFASFIIGGGIEHLLSRRGRSLPNAPSPSQLRDMAAVMAISFAASLISPYFLGQYFFGADLLKDPFIKQQIMELRPPTWELTKWPYVMTAAVALSFVPLRRRLPVAHVLLVTPFLILPFTALRFLFFLGVVGGPVLARNLSVWLEERSWRPLLSTRTAAAMTAAAIIVCTVLTLNNTFTVQDIRPSAGFGIADDAVPEKALAFMDIHGINGRIFNSFQFGGYIAWRDFPKRSVFVDPRGYLPEGLLERHALAEHSPPHLDALEREYGFSAMLLSYPLVAQEDVSRFEASQEYAKNNARWALVYWDDVSLVYLKRGSTYDDLIRSSEYHRIDPMRKLTSAQLLDEQYRRDAIRELRRNIQETGSWRAQVKLAFIYSDAGRFQEAIEWYRKSLAHPDGDRFAAYSGIAHALHGLHEEKESLHYLQKALAIKEDPALLTNAGVWHLQQGDRREALRYLEAALRKDPTMTSLYPMIGKIYQDEGLSDKARELADRQARAVRVDAGKSYFQSGMDAYIRKQYDRAIEEFQRSITANPANAEVYSNLGYVYYDKGMLDKAFEFQRKAIERDPDHANAYYGLALVYKKQGNLQAAKKQWERYLRLEPSGYFSRRAQEEIKAIPPQ